MLRVLGVTSLLAVVGLAMPAAALDVTVWDCTSMVLAFTESDETHVDIYVTEIIGYEGDPREVDADAAKAAIARAVGSAEHALFEPGEVSRGDFVAQVEFQLPHNEDPEVTGIRFTYQVNVNACTGL